MHSVQQKKAAGLYKNQLSVSLQPVRPGWRLHIFILAFGLTLALTGLLAGWSVTGCRCRMITSPPAGEYLVCDIRPDYLRIRVGEWNFTLRVEFVSLR